MVKESLNQAKLHGAQQDGDKFLQAIGIFTPLSEKE